MSSFIPASKRIAIIGGGVAGLTAAHCLKRLCPMASVELFEASARLGGTVCSEAIDGFLVEHGADMFATEPPAAIELCHELKIEEELLVPLPTARGAAIVHCGKLVKIPAGFVLMRPTRLWPMLQTPLLSPLAKARLLLERFVPTRRDDSDESIASFVTRRLGRETLERIVQPLVGGIYTGDVNKLSMAATMPQFREMERLDGSLYRATRRRMREGADSIEQNSAGARYEKFRSFPNGMARLIDVLASHLDPQGIHLSSQVIQIRHDEDGWRITTNSSRHEGPFDHLIIATPANIAAKLLAERSPIASSTLQQIRFASSAVVVLGIRATDLPTTPDIAGVVVPVREGRKILAVSFAGDKFANRTPPGHKLIRVFMGGELQREVLAGSDQDLIRLALLELKELIGLRGEPVLAKVIHWPDAMPQYEVGHCERVATIEAELAKQPGLSLIGNSLHGVGIAPTIAFARKVAKAIAVLPSAP